MLEPVTALGLAGNVIQFLDYGARLVKNGIALHRSVDGVSEVNRELEIVTADLQSMSLGLSSDLPAPSDSRLLADEETSLRALALRSKSLADEFLAKLENLKATGRKSKWRSARKALKSAFSQGETDQYMSRLEALRSQIIAHMVANMSNRQSKLLSGLEDIDNRLVSLELQGSPALEKSRQELLSALEHSRSLGESRPDLATIRTKLLTVDNEAKRSARVLKILESLAFPSLRARYTSIADAHEGMFHWLLDPDSSCAEGQAFLNWLREGHGVFWVAGKPGSGKTTLMKYLCDEPQTEAALKLWVGDKQLIFVKHFFWSAGHDMQQSQQGLLQSLLFHILQQSQDIIPIVCPNRWKMSDCQWLSAEVQSWSLRELNDTLRRIQEACSMTMRFCFFIDGLDEYQGDPQEVVDLVNALACSDNIKLCVSSRPWNVFMNAFGTTPNRFLLEELNSGDIIKFINAELQEYPPFKRLMSEDAAYQVLVEEIKEQAHGVLLWVFLAVRSLRQGVGNDDNIRDLRRRLRQLPRNLEDYFRKMLDSVDEVYHEEAARILLLCLARAFVEEPRLGILCFFDEYDPDFGFNRSPSVFKSLVPAPDIWMTLTKRVKARCPDLLQVATLVEREYEYKDMLGPQVTFLHRSVKDFLQTAEMQRFLKSRLHSPFQVHDFLFQAYLARAKMLPEYGTPEQVCTSLLWIHTNAIINLRISDLQIGLYRVKACLDEVKGERKILAERAATVLEQLDALSLNTRDALSETSQILSFSYEASYLALRTVANKIRTISLHLP